MTIRPATAEDAEHIIAFWNPQIRDTAVTFTTNLKTVEQLRSDIATRHAEGRAFIVAEVDAQVAGFATYFPFRNGPGYAATMEHTIVLAPSFQGAGNGRALMSALEDNARANGVHSMIAGVSSENPGAVAFHRKVGYSLIAEMPEVGRKFDRWMNLILLQKLL